MRLPADIQLKQIRINSFLPIWVQVVGMLTVLAVLLLLFPYHMRYQYFQTQQQANHIAKHYLDRSVKLSPQENSLHYKANHYALASLPKQQLTQLPYRDRIGAANRVGAARLAEQLAYDGLKQHPTDPLMYNLFEQTMLSHADYVSSSVLFNRTNNIEGPQTLLNAQIFLAPNYSLMPYADYWNTQANNHTTIINVPTYATNTGIIFHRETQNGYADFNLGVRKFLASVMYAQLIANNRITANTTLYIKLGYNTLTLESSALLVGGMQRNILINISHAITQRDNLSLEANGQLFYGQDGIKLGNGISTQIMLKHRLFATYPDYTVGLFGETHSYQSDPLHGTILQLLPPMGASTVTVIPQSFLQYGINFQFGMQYLTEYTHAWRPFMLLSAFKNTTGNQLGNQEDIGIAGMLFGRDHLAFYAGRTDGVQGVGTASLRVGANYKMYY